MPRERGSEPLLLACRGTEPSSARAYEIPAMTTKWLRQSLKVEPIIDLRLLAIPSRRRIMQFEPGILIIRAVAKSRRRDLLTSSRPRPLDCASGMPDTLAK